MGVGRGAEKILNMRDKLENLRQTGDRNKREHERTEDRQNRERERPKTTETVRDGQRRSGT